jgi:hypothetical protein
VICLLDLMSNITEDILTRRKYIVVRAIALDQVGFSHGIRNSNDGRIYTQTETGNEARKRSSTNPLKILRRHKSTLEVRA